ncbi:MAG: cytochrome c3 family protein [Acidobacteria bacterium]|nr:cytochrome c3 family protein [Acidobacteriota bacterium]
MKNSEARLRRASLFFLCLLTILYSPKLSAQRSDDCLVCHSDNSLTKAQINDKPVSLFVDDKILGQSTHKILECTACHAGFKADDLPHKKNITPVQCLACHENVESKHPFHTLTAPKIGADPSGMCKNCHGTHEVQSATEPGTKFSKEKVLESCGSCHQKQKEAYLASAHGKAYSEGRSAPTCLQCHSNKITFRERDHEHVDAAQVKIAQEQVCVSCHVNKSLASATAPSSSFVLAYEQSVHGMALKHGNDKAANCVDCHGSHEMKKASDPESRVNKRNVPQTCSQCHSAIAQVYGDSIHGKAFAAGNNETPVCTNCHGEHKILPPKDPNSPVSKLHVSAQVCAPCHSSLKLSEKFGLAMERVSSFNESYHGLATKAGSVEVANCASCHGFHDIRKSSDPKSSVNKANLAITCGMCHPGANENFTKGAVHVGKSIDKANGILSLISSAYLTLILVTVGAMFLHNALDFLKKAKRQLWIRRGRVYAEEVGHALYVRMTRSERWQHGTLAISFIALVFTGFMLKFPDAWWVLPLRSISPAVFELRSLLHRMAATVLMAASFYHIYYIVFVARGRQLIKDLLPRMQDVRDALAVANYNLGMTGQRPLFGRFSYIEKSEYWALIWGTLIMAATGFIMWFDNTFIGLFTKLGFDIARVVHYYEAWLATLSVIVWHFYFVIFNPDVYPMNLAWLKGTISEEEMANEHPLELRELKKKESEDENTDDK